MEPNTRLESLKEQLLAVRRQIVLLELELECARIESGRHTDRSNLGWLFSINASAGGTVVRRVVTGSGGSRTWAASTSWAVPPVNGGVPVNISYARTPTA